MPPVVDEAAQLLGLAGGKHHGPGRLPGGLAPGHDDALGSIPVQALQVLPGVVLVGGPVAVTCAVAGQLDELAEGILALQA